MSVLNRRVVGRFAGGLCLMLPAAASADINDFQIDWVIESSQAPSELHSAKGEIRIDLRPVPRKLYTAALDVLAMDGKALLPAGSQLYLMTDKSFTVCSQAKFKSGYIGQSNRVCLRDLNGDGVPDVYFLRPFNRSILTTDQMWFAMNEATPDLFFDLKSTRLVEKTNNEADVRFKLSLQFSISKNGVVRNSVVIEDKHHFYGQCEPQDISVLGGTSTVVCFVPDMILRTFMSSNDPRYREGVMSLPNRDIAVRFQVRAGIIGKGHNMSSVYFE